MIKEINDLRIKFDILFTNKLLDEKDHRKIVKSFAFMIEKLEKMEDKIVS